MELNSIESHMEKIEQYLEELSKSDKKLYGKTRARLRDLNSQLCHSVELISLILADNILKQDTEFGESLGEMNAEVESLNKDMSAVMQQVSRLNTFVDPSKPASYNKAILIIYKQTLRQVANKSLSVEHVDRCAKLISRWFEARFFTSLDFDKGFKYKLEMIPHWIADIVILYGYCLNQGNFTEVEEFADWCSNIGTGAINTPYAVPYCVHKIAHNMAKEFVTFSGLGLYDLLQDAGYSKLNSPDLHGIICSPYLVQDKFRAYCPDIVDEYTYCGNDESLMRRYKLIGG